MNALATKLLEKYWSTGPATSREYLFGKFLHILLFPTCNCNPLISRLLNCDRECPLRIRDHCCHHHIAVHVGGPGLGILDICIMAEELAWGCSGVTAAVVSSGLAVSYSG